jgi:3-hydroxybutyryl-CoA dehydratase
MKRKNEFDRLTSRRIMYGVGDEYVSYSRTVTETDIVNYLSLARMRAPMFIDEEYCKQNSIFGTRIAPGMFTATVAAGMLEELIASMDVVAALGMDDFIFETPVKAGDTLRAVVRVVEIERRQDGCSEVTSTVEMRNQHDAVPLSFRTRLLTRQAS